MIPDGKINGPWELHGYSDTDYTGDIDTQKSVTVYFVLINIAVITWISGIQKTVTLSFTESEYSEITEVCCKILVSVRFYCLWGLLVNTPLPYMLITLELYSYLRANCASSLHL